MKIQDLKPMDDGALKGKVIELKKELMGLRFQKVTGQVEKTHHIRVARKTVARVKTLLGQRKQTAQGVK
ncbi:50S ribosomal protein L29 [Candidatus Bealeia paramacronuclearis]|uniref:Large ribosomal subunit protein uL29 n=1 Tax=Candidatus Bealeia paramacronuclearis TaxID=1921001 RepID=A0ABZ2C881_9PROT|nr:50S ribosomal protein L29 [Candidatus Bealeia paramacronuclearis]